MVMHKAQLLRQLFAEKKIIRIMGAHNGMSAKLVEEAGFEGIWASGLEVSTSHGVPDANILSMKDQLEACISMNDATNIPVIVDADTGYGNSNNVEFMVKKFESAGIAGVCIEDKLFPKVNSYILGRQELAPIGEFVGKILAAKEMQKTSEFCVFARVEALIANQGMAEAIKRATAYAKAGADAIFIHSKSKDMAEIQEFIQKWNEPTPLMVCPTSYPDFTVAEAEKTGKVKIYIFANHGIRAAIYNMERVMAQLEQTGDIRSVEHQIAPIKKVFEIQTMPTMKEHENMYKNGSPKVQNILNQIIKE